MIDNRENNVWTVYVHIVPQAITEYDYDKYYVGITSRPVEKRWNSGDGYYNQIFYKAIRKYGWDNIEHCIIAEHLTEYEAKEFEKILINKLKCNSQKYKYGYNVTDGGEGMNGYIVSDKTKEKMSKARIGKKNPFYGKKHSKESHLKMSLHHCNDNSKRKVYQFDINGKYLNTYNSVKEAFLSLNLSTTTTHMGQYIKRRLEYHNYFWAYESDIVMINNIPILKYKYNKKKEHNNSKSLYQFDLNGNYISTYSSVKDAVNKANITYSVGECIKKHLPFCGYLWGFKKDVTIINNIPKLNYVYKKKIPKRCQTVYMFDLNGNFIKKYDMAIEASKDNNINNEYITRAARIWNTSCGYYWRYKDGIDFDKNEIPILKLKEK